MSLFLGLDIGTTSTIGIVIRLPNEVLGLVSRPVSFSAPNVGWAEEDPAQWWSNVCAIVAEFRQKGIDPAEISGIGVTGMLPAVVLLDDQGNLIRPSIQQSDGRCGQEVQALRAEVDPAKFLEKAGNGINQQLVTAKLRWVEKHEPENFSRIATVFGSYDYINWRLTGQRATEQNWALEAGFTDLASQRLSDELIALAHIRHEAVAPLIKAHEVLAGVSEQAANATGLKAGTPVVGGAADLIASALAAGLAKKGDVLLKFGGSVDVLVATDHAVPDPRMYLDFHLIPGLFVPNGCMSTGGSGLNWFAQTFASGALEQAASEGLTIHQWLDQRADETPPGADGVMVLPYFLGEKTPIHDAQARGVFAGVSFSHHIGHLWRALMEGYAYAIAHHMEVFKDMGHNGTRYLVSDGGSNSHTWMQIVADVLAAPLQTLKGHPGSCLGAAWAAAIGVGATDDWSAVSNYVTYDKIIKPRPAYAALYQEGYQKYRQLYRNIAKGDASA